MASQVTDITGPEGVARAYAFRLLLQTGKPVGVVQLARSMQSDVEQLTTTLDQLDGAGRIRRDDAGRVIGSAGLSVVPDRHQLSIGDRTFWTWCAYDILGIMGAPKASGKRASEIGEHQRRNVTRVGARILGVHVLRTPRHIAATQSLARHPN